jgi:hypothetical protein
MTTGVIGELSRVRADLQGSTVVFWFVLVGLATCSARTVWGLVVGPAGRRLWVDRTGAVLAAAFGLAWVIVDRQWEGPVLFVVSPGHGVTVSDLASVVAVAAAGAALLRSRNHRGGDAGT